jgi:dTDP-4-dehydrorhamnose reductase
MKIMILGSNGQLGKNIISLVRQKRCYLGSLNSLYQETNLILYDINNLDIRDYNKTKNAIENDRPNIIINCSGYTNVDRAECEKNKAYEINVNCIENLVNICNKIDAVFVHISTDYVFDGKQNKPYTENNITSSLNYYGYTKELSEKIIQNKCIKYYIIRTSWLYSLEGENFFKTIYKKLENGEDLKVIDDQIGTPTCAIDLAYGIFDILDKCTYGIYNYSNLGECSWYEFALLINEFAGFSDSIIKSISTVDYQQIAVRPSYSVLSKTKVLENGVKVKTWQSALKNLISLGKENK